MERRLEISLNYQLYRKKSISSSYSRSSRSRSIRKKHRKAKRKKYQYSSSKSISHSRSISHSSYSSRSYEKRKKKPLKKSKKDQLSLRQPDLLMLQQQLTQQSEASQHYKPSMDESTCIIVQGINDTITQEIIEENLQDLAIECQTSLPDEIKIVSALKCAYVMFPSIDSASKILYKVEGKLKFNGATFSADFYPTGHKTKQGTEAKEGNLVQDWICDRCDYKNFARRLKCHKCDNPRNQNCKVVYNSAAINMRPSSSYQPNAQYLAATMYGTSPMIQNNILMQNQYRMQNMSGMQGNNMHEDSSTNQPTSLYANTSLMIRGQQLIRVTETEILDVFSKYAPVKDIRLVRNKQSGQLRDFAFVEFFTIEEADRVLQQVSRNDFRLLGQPVMVAFSRSKPKREDETVQSTMMSQLPVVQQQNYFREESMDKMLIQEAINKNQQLSQNYDYSQQQQQQQQQSQAQQQQQQQAYSYQQSINYQTDYTQQPYYQQSMQIIQQQQQQLVEQQSLQPVKQPVIQEEIIQPPQPHIEQQQQQQQQQQPKQSQQQQPNQQHQKLTEQKPSQQEQEQNSQKQKALLASVFSISNEQEEEIKNQQKKHSSFTKGPKTEAENRKQIEIEMKRWEKEEQKSQKQGYKLKNKSEKEKKKKKQDNNQLEILMFNQKDPDPTTSNDLNIEKRKIITSHHSEQQQQGLTKLIVCTICKRKFQSEEILRKHELFSELHKKNSEKSKRDLKVV